MGKEESRVYFGVWGLMIRDLVRDNRKKV